MIFLIVFVFLNLLVVCELLCGVVNVVIDVIILL